MNEKSLFIHSYVSIEHKRFLKHILDHFFYTIKVIGHWRKHYKSGYTNHVLYFLSHEAMRKFNVIVCYSLRYSHRWCKTAFVYVWYRVCILKR